MIVAYEKIPKNEYPIVVIVTSANLKSFYTIMINDRSQMIAHDLALLNLLLVTYQDPPCHQQKIIQ